MGQVIPLVPTPSAYPARTTLLDAPECAFLIAVRWWVSTFRHGEDPVPQLCQGLEIVGARDAAFSIDSFMAIVARTVRRPIAIHCPRCPHLSEDEKHLLHAASLVQAGEAGLAERALRTTLLSASGAEFALGPLEGLGELFADARLFLSRRLSPADGSLPDSIETWLPSMPACTVH